MISYSQEKAYSENTIFATSCAVHRCLSKDGVSAGSSAYRAALQAAGDVLPEVNMSTLSPIHATPVIKFEYLNWIAVDPLPRDQAQSHRLHEPEYRINTIDPMTGDDIGNVTSHPSLADGSLTIYFETDATRMAYINMPLDHPNQHLPYPATVDDDRGG